MLVFDIETLGSESNAVVLSAAIVYIDMNKTDHTWESLYKNSLFVKFSVEEQVKQYKRVMEKSTMDWWSKQCALAKNMSFVPKHDDLTAKQGIAILRKYIVDNCNPKTTLIWTRGSLDQMGIDSLCKSCGEELLMNYSNYRDMRTYVDLTATNPVRGYCNVDKNKYPGTWDRNVVIKHNPIDDICLDALMLLYPE